MENWTPSKESGVIKTDLDYYLYVLMQFFICVVGIGGNLLISTYHYQRHRKDMAIFTMMSSFDFLLCFASGFILHSDPIGWFAINTCCFDQILYSRFIIITVYFSQLISGNCGKLCRRTAEKVICIFHVLILMPAFVTCMLQVNVYWTIEETNKSILYCRDNYRIVYGIVCLILNIVCLLTLIGISLQKRLFMKNLTTIQKKGEDGVEEGSITGDLDMKTTTIYKSETGSTTYSGNKMSRRTILIGIIFMIFFSAYVLHNAMHSHNMHLTELSLGISHNIFLIVIFLIHACATPFLYIICDTPFRNYVTSFVYCAQSCSICNIV